MLKIFLLATLIPLTTCNIWDNIYSKYEEKDISLPKKFKAKYKLKEFSFLDINFNIIYNSEHEKIKIFLTQGSSTLLTSLDIDFKNLILQFSQFREEMCLEKKIPKIAKIDISDTRNLWRYLTFYDGVEELNGKKLKKYEFSLEEIEEKIEAKIPKVYFWFDFEGSLEKIEIKLIEESLNFEKVELIKEGDIDFKAKENCFKNEEEFREALKKEQDNSFGVAGMMNKFFEDLIKRFSE